MTSQTTRAACEYRVQIAPVIRPEENLPRTLGDVLHPLEAAYPSFDHASG
jgi:hypothetical protein